MATGDVYSLSAIWERNDTKDDVVNVWNFRQGSELVLDTPGEDLIQAFQLEVQSLYTAIVSVNYTLVKFISRQVIGGDELFEKVVNVPGSRGALDTVLPSQIAAVITWITGQAGRSKRGRTYMPPTAETDVLNGQFSSTYYPDGLQNFADAMIEEMATVTLEHTAWDLVVYSSKFGTATPVVAAIPRQNPGTQRRRRIGQGS